MTVFPLPGVYLRLSNVLMTELRVWNVIIEKRQKEQTLAIVARVQALCFTDYNYF
jgi:hypothetical protein